MKRKNIAIAVAVVSVMGIFVGCKKDENKEPVDVPVETPVEEPVETPEEVEAVEINFTDEIKLVSMKYNPDENSITYSLENKTGFELSYGATYDIFKKQEDGKFVSTGHTEDLAFDMALRTLEIDGFANETLSFAQITKDFEDGKYYIVKSYDNGDGTEAGKFIPMVTFDIVDGKFHEAKADELSISTFPSHINNSITYTILDIDKKLSVSMDAEFYELNTETDKFTKVDFGFENSGLYGENAIGEEYIGLIDFNEVTLDKEGVYEARVNYSLENGATSHIVIPFAVMLNYDDTPVYRVFPLEEYMMNKGIDFEPAEKTEQP